MPENKLLFAAIATMVVAGALWLLNLITFVIAPVLPYAVAIAAVLLVAGMVVEIANYRKRRDVTMGGESVTLADEDDYEPEEEMRRAA